MKEPEPEASLLLDVKSLGVAYPTRDGLFEAVQGFDLTINAGDRVAVVGESGSGKTTACMAIAGMLPSDAKVTAERMEFEARPLRVRRRGATLPTHVPGVATVFQNAMSALDPVWTIESQLVTVIRRAQRVSRNEAREIAGDWVQKVGLRDVRRVLNARPYELSGGMRQRAMIAIALCTSPRLLIADEPTSALDMSVATGLMDLIVGLTQELRSALLMVTHDIGLCRAYTDRTLVMHRGRVVESDRSERVTTTPTHEYTRALIACVPTLDNRNLRRLPTMEGVL